MLNIYGLYPQGAEVFSINDELTSKNDDLLIIARDEQELERLAAQLVFFIDSSKIELIVFPKWDIVPYDRLSPSAKIQSSRISAIYKIKNSSKRKVIITSLAGMSCKFPALDLINDYLLRIKIASQINIDELSMKLVESGYQRSSTAADLGEFAVRGSIVDIIDNVEGFGYRIDFFGNHVESIRKYDPANQVSSKHLEEIVIFPASEVVLNLETSKCFLEEYKNLSPSYFNDQIYQTVKERRRYTGLENWLPLFYSKTSSLLAQLTNYKVISLCDLDYLYQNHIDEIYTNYNNRLKYSEKKFAEDYIPIPPESLWVNKDELGKLLSNSRPENTPSSKFVALEDRKVVRLESLLAKAKLLKEDVFDLFREFQKAVKKTIIIACSSKGSLARLEEKLKLQFSYEVIDKFDQEKIKAKAGLYLALFATSNSYESQDLICIADCDLISYKPQKASSRLVYLEKIKNEISNYDIGDYVIHKTYGVGKYLGVLTIIISDTKHDCLKLVYEDNDIIYLPVENIEYISKYKDAFEQVKLDKLGNLGWQHRKSKVKNRIKELALKLLEIAALRKTIQAPVFVANNDKYMEFRNDFPYVETDDQVRAIEEIEEDLKAGSPMDRLLCGDVGFGKTEVAIRAAFQVVSSEVSPAQVAIIVPTTLLARQHFINFSKRFEKTNLRIKQISRLISPNEVKKTKLEIANGTVDIVIGTHAILAQDVKFHNLGLTIIDEEQHFGVKQKERLKELKSSGHVLTLSATPIPRTLQMSIVGIKDLSLLATPPVDRLSVKTYVLGYDRHVIREAITREFERGGSIFYVLPRIEYIDEVMRSLEEIVPGIKKRVAHGQMKPVEIEELMIDFYNRKFNILISTTIIESGIDLPFVNSIIIDRAEMFGLATLYQLRGRVGRGNIRANAYLVTRSKKLTDEAKARLDVIHSLDNLGGGFAIASNDMDLRGYGNLLGEEQSGQIKEVGLELYQSMLAEAIINLDSRKATGGSLDDDDDRNTQINLGLSVFIPDSYINDPSTKLSIYRKASNLYSYEEIEEFSGELIDRFGKFPAEVANFILTLKIKADCLALNIEKIDVGEKATLLAFKKNIFKNPDKLIHYINSNPGLIKFRPDQKIVLLRQFSKIEDKIEYLRQFLLALKEMIECD